MKINGKNANSRGSESVCIYGTTTRRAVYQIEDEWKFFIKVNGKFIEVYHTADGFSTTNNNRY
jgi:hypothetical protein